MTTDSARTWKALSALAVPKGFGLGTLRAVLTKWGPVVFYGEIGDRGTRMALLRDGKWVIPLVKPRPLPFSGMLSVLSTFGPLGAFATAVKRWLSASYSGPLM